MIVDPLERILQQQKIAPPPQTNSNPAVAHLCPHGAQPSAEVSRTGHHPTLRWSCWLGCFQSFTFIMMTEKSTGKVRVQTADNFHLRIMFYVHNMNMYNKHNININQLFVFLQLFLFVIFLTTRNFKEELDRPHSLF